MLAVQLLLLLLLPLLACYALARLAAKCANFYYCSQRLTKLFLVFSNQEETAELLLRRSFSLLRKRCNKQMELILVNDNSRDHTGVILGKWARKNGCFYFDGPWETVNATGAPNENNLYCDLRGTSGRSLMPALESGFKTKVN